MNRISILFLRIVILLIGIGAFALLLWEPHIEGRNAHATLFEIYFKDPFLAYAYTASIPFFVGLYQASTLLRYIGQNGAFSRNSVRALRTIKYCAIAVAVFVMGGEAYLFLVVRGTDDIAGGVAVGLVMIFFSAVTATAADVFEKLWQTAVEIKSENDLARLRSLQAQPNIR